MSLSTTSVRILNISKDGDSATSVTADSGVWEPLLWRSFFYIQPKPLLVQVKSTSFPITCYKGEEINPRLTPASFQWVLESEVCLRLLFQATQLSTVCHKTCSLEYLFCSKQKAQLVHLADFNLFHRYFIVLHVFICFDQKASGTA